MKCPEFDLQYCPTQHPSNSVPNGHLCLRALFTTKSECHQPSATPSKVDISTYINLAQCKSNNSVASEIKITNMMPSCVAYHLCATPYEKAQEPLREYKCSFKEYLAHEIHSEVCGNFLFTSQTRQAKLLAKGSHKKKKKKREKKKIGSEPSYINIEPKSTTSPKSPEGLDPLWVP